MSWIDENFDDLQAMELQAINELEEKLTDNNISKIYEKLEKDHFFLVCDILQKFKAEYRLTDKQKRCIAKYIFANDLEAMIDD